MSISRRKVYVRVALCWVHTIVALLVTATVMVLLALLVARFTGPRAVLTIVTAGAGLSFIVFLFSPIIVQILAQLGPVDETKYGEFPRVFKELLAERLIIIRPRLFIMNLPIPNAVAFGWGPFRGIAVSPQLYDLMDRAELKSVVGHELAHLVSRDTGLMTVLAIITGGLEQMRKLLVNGRTALGAGPFAWLIAGLIWVLSKAFFPLLRAVMQQQREYSADALSALFCGSAQPMISALRKLEANVGSKDRDMGVLSDLYLSHPGFDNRVASLQDLAV